MHKDSITIDAQLDKDYIGKYYSEEGVFCELIDSTKFYLKFNYGLEEMIPVTDSSFTISQGQVSVTFNKKVKNAFELSANGVKHILRKYEPVVLSEMVKDDYPGIYESDEVNTQYKIMIRGDDLILSHIKYEDVKLEPITVNQFSCPHWWMRNLIFHRDRNGKIRGFEINNGRVLHLYFEKIN
jgi:hypothetical protein